MYKKFLVLLEKAGKSVAQVSRDTGIAENTFSNWKKRGKGVSNETLYKLATYFNVPMEYFMED